MGSAKSHKRNWKFWHHAFIHCNDWVLKSTLWQLFKRIFDFACCNVSMVPQILRFHSFWNEIRTFAAMISDNKELACLIWNRWPVLKAKFALADIYNCDETALFWRALPELKGFRLLLSSASKKVRFSPKSQNFSKKSPIFLSAIAVIPLTVNKNASSGVFSPL